MTENLTTEEYYETLPEDTEYASGPITQEDLKDYLTGNLKTTRN